MRDVALVYIQGVRIHSLLISLWLIFLRPYDIYCLTRYLIECIFAHTMFMFTTQLEFNLYLALVALLVAMAVAIITGRF